MDMAEEVRALRAELAQMREEIAAVADQNGRTAKILTAVTRDDHAKDLAEARANLAQQKSNLAESRRLLQSAAAPLIREDRRG